jgi:hypothetical protein
MTCRRHVDLDIQALVDRLGEDYAASTGISSRCYFASHAARRNEATETSLSPTTPCRQSSGARTTTRGAGAGLFRARLARKAHTASHRRAAGTLEALTPNARW